MSLRLADVSHRYGEDLPWILKDVSAEFEPGRLTALVGPSGAGKTTLLSILGALIPPTRGSVAWDGAGLSSKIRLTTSVSWILQTGSALGHRSALDNVALGSVARGHTHRHARLAAEEALETVGLLSARTRLTGSLSGGETQRVNAARALVSRPRLLLADEPTAHLDRLNAELLMDAMLSDGFGETIVVVATHDPAVARRASAVIEISNDHEV